MDLHILNGLGGAIFGSAHSKGVRYEAWLFSLVY